MKKVRNRKKGRANYSLKLGFPVLFFLSFTQKNFAQGNTAFKNLLPKQDSIVTQTEKIKAPLNPQVLGFKNNYVKKEAHEMDNMRHWGKHYFDIYDKIFTQYQLPLELKYLSVIESSLQSSMRSWAGAVGPWQLMFDEAMRFGLVVNENRDDRMDFNKSTVAAAKLLTELHHQFGDWLLVIAAYNAGPGAVRKAIRKSGSEDFWKLQYYLPQETRNHVKKFISTHYYFEGSGGVTTMTKSESKNSFYIQKKESKLTPQELNNTTIDSIRGFYNSTIITKSIGVNMQLFDRYNPGFNKIVSNGQPYPLRLPKDKMIEFLSKKDQILQDCFHQLLH
ncbi:lytic transglycosylase domain-containing protein [Rhizosphaericola mali]|uniref:Lytic transglycosylase domain-containing protein n=1 Tax=Rhizosphaericola mali TaxID=2545455 RepID=A0A5P2FVX6_9BACT|nr:lytic transglycosylase domain-containing protein [Rhizosphaericola mali]